MPNLGTIVLAAGGSTRMGQPKQLLQVDGQTMIRKTVEIALSIGSKPVVVVLGNAFETIAAEIVDLDVKVVFNEVWKEGMAGSLSKGVETMTALAPHLDQVLMLLCDQPLISTDYLQTLYQHFQNSQKQAIASFYNDVKGVPAIFDFQVLQQFTTNQGDFGARYLIKQLAKEDQLDILPFAAGAIDLDTPEDYKRFLNRK